MNKIARALGLVIAAVALAFRLRPPTESLGIQEGVSVTRFHLGQPIARGAIAVEPADPADASSLEFSQIAARGRARAGPARLDGGAGAMRAPSRSRSSPIDQGSREAMRRRSGLSIGVGGGSGGY